MNFIILGDKFQKRMKSKGCVGLIKLSSKTILQHQHKVIKNKFPNSKIIYIYGFENKKFLNFLDKNDTLNRDVIPIYNPLYNKYNNAYSLQVANDYLNTDCFILFGDNVLHPKIFDKFQYHEHSQIFINNKTKNKLGCIINDNNIENIAYDLDNYLSEIYYISNNDIENFRKLVTNSLYYNYFIFELINKLIEQSSLKPHITDIKKYEYNKL